jgi:hypothetical protein
MVTTKKAMAGWGNWDEYGIKYHGSSAMIETLVGRLGEWQAESGR